MNTNEIRKELNFRDLGGYTAENGRDVKYDTFYRSGPLGNMNEEELEYVKSLGLKHIFDFRSDPERDTNPDPDIPGAVYHPVNALTDEKGNPIDLSPNAIEEQEGFSEDEGKDFMRIMYSNFPFCKAYQEMFDVIKKKETPILFHCTAGKDRTGIAAALILILLGVDEETVLDDYELTNVYRSDFIDRFMKKIAPLIGDNDELRHTLYGVEGVNRENAELSLQLIKDRYGDYETYFKAWHGIDEKTQAELAEYYTDDHN